MTSARAQAQPCILLRGDLDDGLQDGAELRGVRPHCLEAAHRVHDGEDPDGRHAPERLSDDGEGRQQRGPREEGVRRVLFEPRLARPAVLAQFVFIKL